VHFTADRLTAHWFLRVNLFVATDFPDPRFRLESVVVELMKARPRYIIFEQLPATSEMARIAHNLPSDPAVVWLLGEYQLEKEIEDFSLYRRRD
jgi:hypothetical protein